MNRHHNLESPQPLNGARALARFNSIATDDRTLSLDDIKLKRRERRAPFRTMRRLTVERWTFNVSSATPFTPRLSRGVVPAGRKLCAVQQEQRFCATPLVRGASGQSTFWSTHAPYEKAN